MVRSVDVEAVPEAGRLKIVLKAEADGRLEDYEVTL